MALAPCSRRERKGQQKRAEGNSDTVRAVQKVHVRGLVMQRNVVVKRRIDSTGSKLEAMVPHEMMTVTTLP